MYYSVYRFASGPPCLFPVDDERTRCEQLVSIFFLLHLLFVHQFIIIGLCRFSQFHLRVALVLLPWLAQGIDTTRCSMNKNVDLKQHPSKQVFCMLRVPEGGGSFSSIVNHLREGVLRGGCYTSHWMGISFYLNFAYSLPHITPSDSKFIIKFTLFISTPVLRRISHFWAYWW